MKISILESNEKTTHHVLDYFLAKHSGALESQDLALGQLLPPVRSLFAKLSKANWL